MSARPRRQGPGWVEVIFGAVLSGLLGIVLGATLLALRPVVAVKSEPAEREPGRVYFVEGSRDATKGRQALAKRQAWLGGQSISVNEEEINTLVATAERMAGKPAEPAAGEGYVRAGVPNVRIHDGSLQLGVPVTTSLSARPIIFQAHGGFSRKGEVFAYDPATMYLGSLPLHRLPIVAGLVRQRMAAAHPLPEDLQAAWAKLVDVTVEGNLLKLTMP